MSLPAGASSSTDLSMQPPTQPFSAPLPMGINNDDEDEWEYEYSTTEKETYYLTVDLTPTNGPPLRPNSNRGSRGANRGKWLNPGVPRVKRTLNDPPTISLPRKSEEHQDVMMREMEDGATDGDDVEDEEYNAAQSPDAQNTLPDDLLGSNGSKRKDTGTADSDLAEEIEKIQILDLHSENPVVSYKNRTFSCEWAENIGTELIFANHDPKNVLPVLRSLPDGVDLLAASSARLVSRAAELVPKARARTQPERSDKLFSKLSSHGNSESQSRKFAIPIGHAASPARQEQAKFLQRMQEVKARKGETDEVTINLLKRQTNLSWHRELEQKRNDERAKLHRIVRRGGREAPEALKRLEELKDEEKQIAEEQRRIQAGERSKWRGRLDVEEQGPTKRARGGTTGLVRRSGFREDIVKLERAKSNETALMSGALQGNTLSVPTPQTWDELDPSPRKSAEGEDTPMSG